MSPLEFRAYYHDLAQTCKVEGDIVECGVYNGDSLASIAMALPGRDVWAYDSFAGFPAGNPQMDDALACSLAGAVVGVRAQVEEVMTGLGNLTVREGWFAETFLLPRPERIAFLSIDCDLYESVLLTLNTFADLVVPGGIITLDDWTCFPGCRAAFYEWMRGRTEHPLLTTFGAGQAYWVA